MTTRRAFVRGSVWGLIAGAGFALPRHDGLRLADRLGVSDGPATVLLFQLSDCPSFRSRLGQILPASVVGRLLGAGGLSAAEVREVLDLSGITFPTRRLADDTVPDRLRALGHPSTPLLLRFAAGGRLRSIEASFELFEARL